MASLVQLGRSPHGASGATARLRSVLRIGTLVLVTLVALTATKLLLAVQPFPFILPLAAVIVSSVVAGTAAGLIATLICVVAIARFVLGPPTVGEYYGLIAFGLAGVFVAWVGGSLRATYTRLERANHRSDEEFEVVNRVMAALGEGICAVNSQGRIVFVSPAAERILGRPGSDLRGQPFPLFDKLCTRAGMASAGCTVLCSPTNRDRAAVDQSRSQNQVRCRCWPLADGGFVVALDEYAERDADRGNRLLVEASRQLSESIDYDATIRRIAQLAARNLGTWCAVALLDAQRRPRIVSVEIADPSKAAAAREVADRCTIDLAAEHGFGRVLRTGEPELVREVLHTEVAPRELLAGLHVMSFMAVPLRARGELLGVIAFADSERRFDDAELMLAQELAYRCALALDNAVLYRSSQEAKRAREEILAIVSHDLRNPLNVITTGASSLEHAMSPTPEGELARNVSRLVSRSAARMNRLIEDLLDFASIESGRLSIVRSPQDARALVREAIEASRSFAEDRGVELSCDVPPASLVFECDRDRVLQVFANLLSNAVQVTPDGRLVVVSVREAEAGVIFCVRDVGPGIALQDLPHVFDRYWRGDQNYKGAGLGLSIVKSLVELHGGRIWVESTAGMGSAFFFSLPAVNMITRADVFVVEDDRSTRESISQALKLEGYAVTTAADGREAWEQLHRSPPPCLILLDVMMPVMNGPEFLELLHADARLRSVPVAVVSAFGSIAAPVAAKSQGYLSKPIDLDQLLALSARFCAHKVMHATS